MVPEAWRAGHWQPVDAHNRVQEVRLASEAARYFVIDSAKRWAREQSLRHRA